MSTMSLACWGPQLSEKEVKALLQSITASIRAYLNMILNGKRPVSDSIATAVGLRKVYVAQNSAKG
jgi:hypothetical protein